MHLVHAAPGGRGDRQDGLARQPDLVVPGGQPVEKRSGQRPGVGPFLERTADIGEDVFHGGSNWVQVSTFQDRGCHFQPLYITRRAKFRKETAVIVDYPAHRYV